MRVTIDLGQKTYLLDYLKFLYGRGEPIRIRGGQSEDSKAVLEHLRSQCISRPANYKDPERDFRFPVEIDFAFHTRTLQHDRSKILPLAGEFHFLSFLNTTFLLEFHQFMHTAQVMRIPNKRAISLFMFSHGLNAERFNAESFIKQDFRFRRKIKERVLRSLSIF